MSDLALLFSVSLLPVIETRELALLSDLVKVTPESFTRHYSPTSVVELQPIVIVNNKTNHTPDMFIMYRIIV